MKVSFVKHNAPILIGDYQFADRLKEEVFSRLKFSNPITKNSSNVKASIHTEWDWEPENITFRNLKVFLKEEIERNFKPGSIVCGDRTRLQCHNFWANVYEKGDYAREHDHTPCAYSFAYFLKAKWYHPPLIFTYSGKKIRPKEGRYVIFPGFLRHRVPKHQYKDTRITLSGNYTI
tara:strand:- start:200 stop:727 length:528 start_codon:yes stop_codon:yes gene_type:complete